jgi:hypothetical protein
MDPAPQDLDLAEILSAWRQGDAILGNHLRFVHVADLTRPLTAESKELAISENGIVAVGSTLAGGIIVTQTCDIVRNPDEYPFVQAAALIEISQSEYTEIVKGQRPNFAAVPGLADRFLVARLDLITTAEKTLLVNAPQNAIVRGCRSDAEQMAFAECLSRKYSRFAFPDDFTRAVAKVQKKLREKHSSSGDNGEAFRALSEIRVAAIPSWDAKEPELLFLFVRSETASHVEVEIAQRVIGSLMEKFDKSGRFHDVRHRVVLLSDITASLYLSSQPLDLDHLSSSWSRNVR